MKVELETQDIDAISQKLAERIKPLLPGWDRHDDTILDVKGLCDYLQVTPKWVYERTHRKEIPYYKPSNKQLRFRKKEIDRWLDSYKIPAINEYRGPLRVAK